MAPISIIPHSAHTNSGGRKPAHRDKQATDKAKYMEEQAAEKENRRQERLAAHERSKLKKTKQLRVDSSEDEDDKEDESDEPQENNQVTSRAVEVPSRRPLKDRNTTVPPQVERREESRSVASGRPERNSADMRSTAGSNTQDVARGGGGGTSDDSSRQAATTTYTRAATQDREDQWHDDGNWGRGRSLAANRSGSPRGRSPSVSNTTPSGQNGSNRSDSPHLGEEAAESVGAKHARSASPGDGEYAHVDKSPKTSRSMRAKTADFDLESQELIVSAIAFFRCAISTETPWPDKRQEVKMAKAAWKKALAEHELEDIKAPSAVIKLVTRRGSQCRGELKTKVRPLVESLFGFDTSSKSAVAKNIAIAAELLDNYAFVYKARAPESVEASGLFEHPIIQKAINAMWFVNRSDEGVKYADVFTPFPHQALALVLTAIQCCIDEWSTGVREKIEFSAASYSSDYNKHLEVIEDFAKRTVAFQMVPKLLTRILKNARFHAKVEPNKRRTTHGLNEDQFTAAIEEFEARAGTYDSEDEAGNAE
ncbi:hypothetical protein BD410DRAFT_834329 [Rickenella mellea]|uniref:DUF6532 domain-containing protein n=1 Tax=Rickenella mellea TaxID=50990 RepID=A0A4R5XII3_9AGAM|nr:hypothetical protein BD410DRAFT_834329 [Rickenella mellea]